MEPVFVREVSYLDRNSQEQIPMSFEPFYLKPKEETYPLYSRDLYITYPQEVDMLTNRKNLYPTLKIPIYGVSR